MSNSNSDRNNEKKIWLDLNKDLKQALDTWDDLAEKTANKASPEQQQLKEVKKLLGELKDKLKEFSE